MVEQVYAVNIRTPYEHQIHGVEFRVHFQPILAEECIRATIRNLKGYPVVRIEYVAENEDAAKSFTAVITRSAKKLLVKLNPKNDSARGLGEDEIDVSNPSDTLFSVKPEDITRVKIHREDELTEMVWALQGAGRVFTNAVEAITIRDERKKWVLATAAIGELAMNADLMKQNATEGQRTYSLSNGVVLALLNNVEDFKAEPEVLLAEELAQLVALINAYNNAPPSRVVNDNDNLFKELLDRINDLQKKLVLLTKATGNILPEALKTETK